MIERRIIEEAGALRRLIHSEPELSWNEGRTAGKIADFISRSGCSELITGIAGSGLAAVFEGEDDGPTVIVRAELDALPIKETNSFRYRSRIEGVSHKCGHDGHMSIVAGLARVFADGPPAAGRAVLLFQPAEETGEGAARVISDSRFQRIKPDFSFALHNLPGYKTGEVIISYGNFASASRGMVIDLTGKTSHAAEPGRGISPALAMSDIIRELTIITEDTAEYDDFILATVVHARLGEVALGTSPGEARIIATLRAFLDRDMEKLAEAASAKVKRISADSNLGVRIGWMQEFPSTVNDGECARIVAETAEDNGLAVHVIEEPFRWSEDFGHFTSICPGALFGLGAGTGHASLHNPDYDFPDELVETGIGIFSGIIYRTLGKGRN
jgi:amidohydrolase